MSDEIILDVIGKKFYIDGNVMVCTSGGDFQLKELYKIISENGLILEDLNISSFEDNIFVDSKVLSIRELKIDEPLYKINYDVYGYGGNCHFYTYSEQNINTSVISKRIDELDMNDLLVHANGYVNILNIDKIDVDDALNNEIRIFEITIDINSSDNLFLNNILFKHID